MTLRQNILFNISLVVLVIFLGATGYVLIEGWSYFDGLYMTVIALTTIGYGETNPLSFSGRVFTICLILTGISTITYSLGSLSAYFFGQQVYTFLSTKHMQEKITKLKDHYIICGASEVGLAVAEEMVLEKVPVLLIDSNEDKLKVAMEQLNCLGLVGDATNDDVLLQANIKNAKGLVATFGNDHENVYLIMSARQLNPQIKIYSKVKDEQTSSKLIRAGADHIINPYKIGGMRLASSILRPKVVRFLDELAKDPHKLRIEELDIDKDSTLLNQSFSIEEVEKKLAARIIAFKKAKNDSYQHLFTHAPIQFELGDSLFFVQSKQS